MCSMSNVGVVVMKMGARPFAGRPFLVFFATLCVMSITTTSLVDGAPQNLGSDGSRDFGLAENVLEERAAAPINNEYNYLRDLMARRAKIRYAQNFLKQMDDRLSKVHKRTQLCLPSTDCDFNNWGAESDAKDVLAQGADSNPGRRKRATGPDSALAV